VDRRGVTAEVGAGLVAALMVLPSAIGNGLLAYAGLGAEHAAAGALAGLIGAVVLGGVAAALGGTPGLVSSPSGPAAAMLTALGAQLAAHDPARAPALLTATMLLAGLIQLAFGALRLGTVAKFIPYPVVAGFLSAAGLLLAWGQLPPAAGVAGDPLQALTHPGGWQAVTLVTAGATVLAMSLTARWLPRVPPVLAGLAAGTAAWFAWLALDPALAAGGALRVGAVPPLIAVVAAVPPRLATLLALHRSDLALVAPPAVALAALLSIDTLKTCVAVDSVTGGRHAPSRELLAQGLGNAVAALAGGSSGAGVAGASLVNVAAGGRTRLSSVTAPSALLALVAVAPVLVAGIPRAVLAGVLIHVGLRAVDWGTLRLVRRRERRLDLTVVLAVVVIALASGLVTAAAAGVGMVVVLYLRDRLGQSPVRQRGDLSRLRSTHRRLPVEDAVLAAHGGDAAVLTLQGDLFFGTADRLLTELAPDLACRRLVLLDLARVTDIDLTAVRILAQAQARLAARGAALLLAEARAPEPLEAALRDLALRPGTAPPRLFASRDEALEWVEERLLETHLTVRPTHQRLSLAQMDLVAGLEPAALAALERHLERLSVGPGQPVFRAGEPGGALFLVALGRVRLAVPTGAGRELMIGVFGRGDVFGELAFIDARPRSANAVACADTELYVLGREAFEAAVAEEPSLRAALAERLNRVLSYRLRVTTRELKAATE
jgi:SulP family sulfate permease